MELKEYLPHLTGTIIQCERALIYLDIIQKYREKILKFLSDKKDITSLLKKELNNYLVIYPGDNKGKMLIEPPLKKEEIKYYALKK